MVVPVSRRLSATGIRFLVILCPPGSWAFLAVGLPVLLPGPDPDGVATFRAHELRPGWARMSCGRGGCPLYPGDCGARTAGRSSPAAACRLAAARPCTPVQQPTTGGFSSRGIIKGSRSFTRPAFPWPVAPGWSGSPRACSPGLHTPPLPAAHAGVGTGIVGTCLSYVTISWSSSRRSHSPRATSCRTDLIRACTLRTERPLPVLSATPAARPAHRPRNAKKATSHACRHAETRTRKVP